MLRKIAEPKEIRAALAAYLARCEADGEEPVTETYRFTMVMEHELKIDWNQVDRYRYSDVQQRFRSQVLRELNLLAAAGTLVKRGNKQGLEFMTPAAAARRDERTAQWLAQEAEDAKRTAELFSRLAAIGVEPLVRSGAAIALDTEDWEILVRLAEKGRGNG